MANREFNLKTGMQYIPVTITDDEGNKIKIGTAIYDLNDTSVKSRLIEFYNDLKDMGSKYKNIALELEKDKATDENDIPLNSKELLKLDETATDEMIVLVDKIFQDGFCKKAIGNTKNPDLIIELLGLMLDEYQVRTEAEKNKYVNRAQRRASNKKK